ncbi:acetyl-CoA synthetase-like protein [Coniophora puteana RWD-64-598 SS2]|uniref:Acetyl-CoA synthetase-like protein n=1 Tax=Coniophora puteana (strain RWD-64-598) TaxID=741705 RepID=A0A5M3MWV8_CONPW|nr:acetyl-CoA synthetase-like protein [Coniophora puteana RWD-64-598 SS2]EIW83606.1 acetyl-CoA synthetase-like protein [Coniophora puteana RWD-64-598 SS2]
MLLGAAAAGHAATLANSAYTAAELAYQYEDSHAHLVLAHPPLVPTVREMMRSLSIPEDEIARRIIVADSTWLTGAPAELDAGDAAALKGLTRLSELVGRGELAQEIQMPGLLSDSTVYLCYSSGTTGKPKGVESTHHNIISELEILKPTLPPAKVGPALNKQGKAVAPYRDAYFGVLPSYHIYGAIWLLHFPLTMGAPSIILHGRFEPEKFCAAVQLYKATIGIIVPPILVVFAKHPAVDKYDMSSLETLISGAAPLGGELVSSVKERLGKRGADVCITQQYGLTETSPSVFLLPQEHAVERVGSVGYLLPNLEARLVSEEDGEKLTSIEGAGEIWVRGPIVMKGYLNNPTATAKSVTPDGWFKTGDIAVRSKEGFYNIVDRRKELIKYKGFQVAPADLENVLLQHPQIADAAVIGVESKEQATELPRAYVVKTSPELTSAAVQEFVASRVANHKKLRGGVIFIDAIPKSAAGKILRQQLRKRAESEPVELPVRAKL